MEKLLEIKNIKNYSHKKVYFFRSTKKNIVQNDRDIMRPVKLEVFKSSKLIWFKYFNGKNYGQNLYPYEIENFKIIDKNFIKVEINV